MSLCRRTVEDRLPLERMPLARTRKEGGGGAGCLEKGRKRQSPRTKRVHWLRNSIAFGNAPRREADSQPISQLDRPAVSETERSTHFGFFVSGRHGSKQWGAHFVPGLAVAEW